MKMHFGRKTMMGAIGTLVAVGIGLAVIGAVGIVGWEYSNSDEFCANDLPLGAPGGVAHPQHRRCTRACAASNATWAAFDAAADRDEADAHQGTVGHDRRLRAAGPPPQPCGRRATTARACHWPSAEHHDSVAVKKRYGNRCEEQRRRLPPDAAHDGYGVRARRNAKGIHWHIDNEVLFKTPVTRSGATIPWVQVKTKDGTKVTTYVDPTSKISADRTGQGSSRAAWSASTATTRSGIRSRIRRARSMRRCPQAGSIVPAQREGARRGADHGGRRPQRTAQGTRSQSRRTDRGLQREGRRQADHQDKDKQFGAEMRNILLSTRRSRTRA